MRQAFWAGCALVAGVLLSMLLVPTPDEVDAAAREGENGDALEPAALPESALDPVRMTSALRLNVPDWRVGDAWRVQFADGEPVCWMVVVDRTEEGYQQGIWCPDEEETELIAAQIATFDLPYLGRFSPSLEGRTDVGAFRFYDWPLEDGKTWAGTWGERDVTITATFSRAEGRYQMTAVDAEGSEVVRYDYDPALRWWTRLEVVDGFLLQVLEREAGWEGPVIAATGQDRYREWRGNPNALRAVGSPAATFSVGEEDDMVALVIEWRSVATGRFEVRDSNGFVTYQTTRVGTLEDVFTLMPGTPGLWSIVDGVVGGEDGTILLRGLAFETYEL